MLLGKQILLLQIVRALCQKIPSRSILILILAELLLLANAFVDFLEFSSVFFL
jgi:hypothetical protein